MTPRMQVETIVSYATETLGLKTFAILYPEDNYGNTFVDLFWDDLIHRGGQVVRLGVREHRIIRSRKIGI